MLYLSFFVLHMTSFTTTTLRFITLKLEICCSIKAPDCGISKNLLKELQKLIFSYCANGQLT
jgi:hypothetical protein